ncbi:MAG TPA: carboxymuconolactone decarboxylase family protein [Thermoanaerobaculia bacterium]|nr:carboxymuconolactone decarboxylase family protein [Thermoanaerobaculia bacterium]
MKRMLCGLTLLTLVALPAPAQEAAMADPAVAVRQDIEATLGLMPGFFAAFPPAALPGAWQNFKAVQLSNATELPGKEKELIGLAVAAQVPCRYCVYAHTQAARANGADDAEIAEAVAMAALTRQWSTVLNGSLADEAEFRSWADAAFAHAAEAGANAVPVQVVDAASAMRDIAQLLGTPPPFLQTYPAAAVAGAWQELKALQMSGDTALPARVKELIGLAVAAQIPCRYCSYAHTKAARLNGASEQQVQEALAMAALTRHWSTWLHGIAVDEATFRADFDAILRNAAAQAAAESAR